MTSPKNKKGEESVSVGTANGGEPMEVESEKTPTKAKEKSLPASQVNQSESSMETNEETATIQFPSEGKFIIVIIVEDEMLVHGFYI